MVTVSKNPNIQHALELTEQGFTPVVSPQEYEEKCACCGKAFTACDQEGFELDFTFLAEGMPGFGRLRFSFGGGEPEEGDQPYRSGEAPRGCLTCVNDGFRSNGTNGHSKALALSAWYSGLPAELLRVLVGTADTEAPPLYALHESGYADRGTWFRQEEYCGNYGLAGPFVFAGSMDEAADIWFRHVCEVAEAEEKPLWGPSWFHVSYALPYFQEYVWGKREPLEEDFGRWLQEGCTDHTPVDDGYISWEVGFRQVS